jgi:uncharacterized membrane protein
MNTTTAPIPPAAEPDGLRLVLPARSNPASAGWDWIAQGWKLFVRAPLMWIIAMVLLFIAFVALSLVPILGSIAVQLLQPVVAAGLIVAAHSLDRGGEFELEHLFAGFKKNFGNLVLVGLLFLLAGIAVVMVFVAFVAFSVGTAFLTGDPNQALATLAASALTLLLGVLIMLALLVPLAAAYWFAPALVIMHDLPPVAEMMESFFGCFRNFVPFLVYGIVLFFLAILAAIPFGLGFLALVPVVMASIYVGYRQIFTEEVAAPAPPKPTL